MFESTGLPFQPQPTSGIFLHRRRNRDSRLARGSSLLQPANPSCRASLLPHRVRLAPGERGHPDLAAARVPLAPPVGGQPRPGVDDRRHVRFPVPRHPVRAAVLGYDAMATGLAVLPTPVAIVAGALFLSPRFNARFGERRVLPAGLCLIVAGLALLGRAPVDGDYAVDVLPICCCSASASAR